MTEQLSLQLEAQQPSHPAESRAGDLPAEEAETQPCPTLPAARRRLTPNRVGPALRADLHHRLEKLFGSPLASLTLTDNRTTIFSSKKRRDGTIDLRIHAGFAEASDDLLRDVVVCSTNAGRTPNSRARRQESLERVRHHFDELHRNSPRQRRRTRLRTRGEVYDLETIYEEINDLYFSGTIQAEVTWGQGRRGKRRRRAAYSIQLGSYVYEDKRIRIHPLLDSAKVPRFVIEAVMHHEMVHAQLGQGCDRPHGPEFRALERRFVRLAEADSWLDSNLARLIRTAERKKSG